jgi:hypothetical protein
MTKPPTHLQWQDWFLFAGIALAVAGLLIENSPVVYIGLGLTGLIAVIAIVTHQEFGKGLRVLLCILVVIGTAYLIRARYVIDTEKELKSNEGSILADATPNPLSTCPVPEDAIAIYFGDSASWTKNFPHTVFSVHGENVFVLDKDTDGNLLVTVRIFDDRGDLVARLEKNRFITTSAASRMERPNKNSLVIFDHTDQEVLDVQFLNPKAIQITGTLRYPGISPVVIEEHRLHMTGSIVTNFCFGGPRVDFAL